LNEEIYWSEKIERRRDEDRERVMEPDGGDEYSGGGVEVVDGCVSERKMNWSSSLFQCQNKRPTLYL
jgi:hypothetical protein